ncbi:energy-coupling factor transporter transmembrane protein EcfT [Microbacterium sp. SYP-A9085]|uniref:CbiQ family ECF transporter T component n=1 Tax=Microbacterium sp. SYP-A9085 TaxID=2664454 RepID=UPI00129BB6B3|nr:CbiQ family ECF transporter T component [Microbacterium sp. SYP-A9085]MRH28551.1 energy-coupling factor transporter transmembrane protein EcfT [Microbacterium sp. SYP-A9085]
MLMLFRPGTGILYRLPAGPKLAGIALLVLAVSLAPPELWVTGAIGGLVVVAYAVAGFADGMLGMGVLARQAWGLRWVIALMLVAQLVFLGPVPAVVNTGRVTAAILLAALLALTTRVTDLLDALERGLAPLHAIRLDPGRIALMLTVALTTLPVMARIAHQVREAQRARGARPGIRRFAVPYLVMTLKHADELGDALAARGVR